MALPPVVEGTNTYNENIHNDNSLSANEEPVTISVVTAHVRNPFPPLHQGALVSDVASHDGADSGIDLVHETPILKPSGTPDVAQIPTSKSSRKQKISRHLPDSPCYYPDPNYMRWGSPHPARYTTGDPRAAERLLRLATASARQRMLNQRSNSLTESLFKIPGKVITWHEAMTSRPPLHIDMSGPSPTTYSPRNKPLYETNAPAYSFGRKEAEKEGSGQKAWGKLWFRSHTPFTHKTNYELRWPSAPLYEQKTTLGPNQISRLQFPSHSIGVRHNVLAVESLKTDMPGSNQYEPGLANRQVLQRAPAFTMGCKLPNKVWVNACKVPAPNTYNPKPAIHVIKPSHPAFTMCVERRHKRHDIGPFATL